MQIERKIKFCRNVLLYREKPCDFLILNYFSYHNKHETWYAYIYFLKL